MPYAGRLEGPRNLTDRASMRSTLEAVVDMVQKRYPKLLGMGEQLQLGPAASLGEEPSRATGTALDFMYTNLSVKDAFMFEVYGTSRFFPMAGAFRSEIAKPPRARPYPRNRPARAAATDLSPC